MCAGTDSGGSQILCIRGTNNGKDPLIKTGKMDGKLDT